MGEVFEINQKKFFTLDSAKSLLPVVKRITHQAQTAVSQLTLQHSFSKNRERKTEIESQIHQLFDDWAEKIQKLGADVKGMWLVDFDSGEGYFCWKFPEENIEHFHTYDAGFGGRVRIDS